MSEAEKLDDSLVKPVSRLIASRDYVSFAELSQLVRGFWDEASPLVIERRPNLMLWGNVTQAGADAMLLLHERLSFAVCAKRIYELDGMVPSLPLAQRDEPQRRPHWLPVILRIDRLLH